MAQASDSANDYEVRALKIGGVARYGDAVSGTINLYVYVDGVVMLEVRQILEIFVGKRFSFSVADVLKRMEKDIATFFE